MKSRRNKLWTKLGIYDKINSLEREFMEYADKTIKCEKCGEDFIFPCGEQKFFEEKGFIPPKKCPKCRGKENVQRPSANTFETLCLKCKKKFNITFDPKGQEVLCYECFELEKLEPPQKTE